MNLNISPILSIVGNDKNSVILLAIFLALILLLSSLSSSFYGFTLFSCYLIGRTTSFYLINYHNSIKNYIKKLISYYSLGSPERDCLKLPFSIYDRKLQSHLVKNVTPWKNIKINRKLNTAIEKFYNRIISNFVVSWYGHFASNEDFLYELRYCIRYATAEFVHRFLEIDHVEVIINKLMPQVVRHLDDYFCIQEISQLKKKELKTTVIEYLGKNIHPAARNRNDELAYLQHLSNKLIKLLLPADYSQCKNYSVLLREIISGWVLLPLIDTLADPNIINYLVITAVTHYPIGKSGDQMKYSDVDRNSINNDDIKILENFFQPDEKISDSSFELGLNKIRNNTQLLHAFIKFLEKKQHTHLLQFCTDVDDFNAKLLKPDLTKNELETLHSKATELHKKYLTENSFNFIDCPINICYEYQILIKDIGNVSKLSTSQPLYQAYDFTISHLENVWLPQFFHSDEFYNCICGSRVTPEYHKTSKNHRLNSTYSGSPSKERSKKYYEPPNTSTVDKISNSLGKIRGVLKSMAPIDGAVDVLDEDISECLNVEENLIVRDLSSWKVTIPLYKVSLENKVPLFCLNIIQEVQDDNNINNWKVWRRDQDFFTLKAKLVEFHGESQICDSPLPLRKAGTIIESRISKYEEFIAKLLQKPSLRSSDLLHMFLTEDDFILAITTMAPANQDIGNIYQSVTYKLRKERGQYLDGFITTFYNSVMKTSQDIDVAEEGAELDKKLIKDIYPKTFQNHVFNDNFGIHAHKEFPETSASRKMSLNLNQFSDCLLYLFKNVFNISTGFLKIYVVVCNIAEQLVVYMIKRFINKKLKEALSQSNLANLIGLLEEKIFTVHTSLTQKDYNERKSKAFKDIQMCPAYLDGALGGGINRGFETLLEVLQSPCCNKQLAYNLLDIVLLEMFVELESVETKQE